MDFTTLFTGLLFVALIYLHIKQSNLIFQHDIKIAKILAIILLCLLALKNTPLSAPFRYFTIKSTHYGISLYFILTWTLSILIVWKILSGCYKDAFFKRIGKPGQSLREKIRDIIWEAIQENKQPPAFKLFLKTCFEDPVIDSVRRKCKSILNQYQYSQIGTEVYAQEQLEKLKELVKQLG